MHRHTARFVTIALFAFGSAASAQVVPQPNTGCRAGGGGVGTALTNPTPPTLGNLVFSLNHTCPPGATGALFVWSNCADPFSTVDWNLSNPCFGGAIAPPCRNGLSLSPIFYVGFEPVNSAGIATYAVPLVDLLPWVDLRALSRVGAGWCFQAVSLDTSSGTLRCLDVSSAASVVVQ